MEISNGRLSEAQREQFLNEGYLIADNVFDPDDLSPLRDELSGEIDGYTRELKAEGQIIDCHEDKDFDHRLTHIYREDPKNAHAICRHLEGKGGGGYCGREMFHLITHPKLLRTVASIVGDEIVASSVYRIRTKIPDLPKGEVPWHQDSGYFSEHCDQNLIVACYPPEADFRVQSNLHAMEVATFQSYRERRLAFENATSIPSPIKDRWTALPEVS